MKDITPILKTKAKPKPDETDQGQLNRHYRTRSTTRGPSQDHDDDIQPPSVDLHQERKHRYDLRSLNADFEQQSLHFDMPSIAINDMDPFPVNSIFPAKEITCNWIRMFSLKIMGRVTIYLMILMGSTHLKIYLMVLTRSNHLQSIWKSMK